MTRKIILIGERHSVVEQTLWFHIAQNSSKVAQLTTQKPINFTTEVLKSSFLVHKEITSFLTNYNCSVWKQVKEKVPQWSDEEFPQNCYGEDIHGFAYFNLSLLKIAKANSCKGIQDTVVWLYKDRANSQLNTFQQKMEESFQLLKLFIKTAQKDTSSLVLADIFSDSNNATNLALKAYEDAIVLKLKTVYGEDNFSHVTALYEKDVQVMNKVYQSYAIMYRDLFMYDVIRTVHEGIQYCSVGYGHARNILKIHELLKDKVAFEYIELL